jgi:stage II sporulation protein R
MIYLLVALACLMMSWESSAADAAIAGQLIPEESIRLRILANSDSPADQLLKRRVRDAVVAQMNEWVTEQDHIDQAREAIRSNMPAIEQLVRDTLAAYGYDYEVTVELGPVDFPTKLYGNVVYPAGVYEALLISIGKAEGQNWWCVLFPPLCFVDMATGGSEPVAAYASDSDVTAASAKPVSEQDKEVRFFLWDMLLNLFRWLGSLF